MEHLVGETLAKRLEKGAVPLETAPAWNPAGGEIFFLASYLPAQQPMCRAMMIVDVKTEPALVLGRPRTLFEWEGDCPLCNPTRCFDVSPDGQQLLKAQGLPAPERTPVTHIRLIQNWLSELERRVPTK